MIFLAIPNNQPSGIHLNGDLTNDYSVKLEICLKKIEWKITKLNEYLIFWQLSSLLAIEKKIRENSKSVK